MKAEASRTPESNFNPAEQVTPVIVKIGGDMIADSANPMTIDINSAMPFNDITGKSWHEALSTKTGRITELSINDGSLHTIDCTVSPQPDVLTSLELSFPGQEQFRVSEVKDDTNGTYLLKVESSGTPSANPFQITDKDPDLEGSWFGSQGTFSSSPLGLVFMQKPSGGGDDLFSFEYTFNNISDVRFNLDFHRDPHQ